MKAEQVAQLPPEQRPPWYRPPSGAPASWRPARPYAEGNVERMAAGHRAPRVYSQVAAALVVGLIEQRPELASYPETLASWSDAEARAALLRKHLDDIGMIDTDGTPRESLLRQLERFERRAADARARLGLDPRSEAELALLRARAMREGQLAPAVDLDALRAQGRAVLGADDPVQAALDRVRAEAAQGAAVTTDSDAADGDLSDFPADPDPTPEETTT